MTINNGSNYISYQESIHNCIVHLIAQMDALKTVFYENTMSDRLKIPLKTCIFRRISWFSNRDSSEGHAPKTDSSIIDVSHHT